MRATIRAGIRSDIHASIRATSRATVHASILAETMAHGRRSERLATCCLVARMIVPYLNPLGFEDNLHNVDYSLQTIRDLLFKIIRNLKCTL